MSFFTKTVDKVVAEFHTIVAKLEDVAVEAQDKYEDKTNRANLLQAEAKQHLDEAVRANVVAGKIKALLA